MMNQIKVDVCKMYPDVVLPQYQTNGSAGCDVRAYLTPFNNYPNNSLIILPGETTLIPTGLRFSLPQGYELQIRARSGLSLKTKLRIANQVGTLDSDYTGELMVIMENTDYLCGDGLCGNYPDLITIKHGDRIAQLIFAPVVQAVFMLKEELIETERGSGGMGSTGIK